MKNIFKKLGKWVLRILAGIVIVLLVLLLIIRFNSPGKEPPFIDENGNIIDEDFSGVARELARMNLPINAYTQWYWKIDLHNLMHFLRLRADNHAQYEIRVYADIMIDIMEKWVPFAFEAFVDHRLNNTQLSGRGTEIVKKLLRGEEISQEDSGMSKREWTELMEVLEINDKNSEIAA